MLNKWKLARKSSNHRENVSLWCTCVYDNIHPFHNVGTLRDDIDNLSLIPLNKQYGHDTADNYHWCSGVGCDRYVSLIVF